jgi:hypothetical protein
MSAMADLIAFDGAPTPISHTFKPVSVSREKGLITALWREQVTSLPLVAQGSVLMKLNQLPSKIWRTSIRIGIPVMESVSGQNAAGYTAAPQVAYDDTVEIVGFFHERSSILNHRIVRGLAYNILAGFTTSNALPVVGPAPELVDGLIAPT